MSDESQELKNVLDLLKFDLFNQFKSCTDTE